MEKFTATHQALLIAWISRAVIKAVGEKKGAPIVRKAVIQYARQRGKRMALRARSNGHALTMNNYFAYVELGMPKAGMKQKIIEKSPHTRIKVEQCIWHTAWKENNLMAYGRYFCQEVDKAVVKGFSENLEVDVKGTLSNDAEYCDFIFKTAQLTLPNMIKLIYNKLVHPGKKAVLPWEYHTGHVYKTMAEVIQAELGQQAQEIMAAALNDFTKKYGEEAGKIVTGYENTDFNRLAE